MTAVRDALIARDVPRENIHYEVFGPDTGSLQHSTTLTARPPVEVSL